MQTSALVGPLHDVPDGQVHSYHFVAKDLEGIVRNSDSTSPVITGEIEHALVRSLRPPHRQRLQKLGDGAHLSCAKKKKQNRDLIYICKP